MSASIVNVFVADPPVGACIPPEIQTWIQGGIYLQQSGLNNSQRILVQQFSPGPDELDVLWERISAIGAPLGFFSFYNGAWRRFPTVPIGLRGYYTGPITSVFDPVTFIGLPGTEWDGWKIDLTYKNLFPVVAASYNAGTLNWETSISGSNLPQGGQSQLVLDPTNVPLPSRPAITTYLRPKPVTADTNFVLWGEQNNGGTLSPSQIAPAEPGNPNPIAFAITPPYVAMAQVVFIGVAV